MTRTGLENFIIFQNHGDIFILIFSKNFLRNSHFQKYVLCRPGCSSVYVIANMETISMACHATIQRW